MTALRPLLLIAMLAATCWTSAAVGDEAARFTLSTRVNAAEVHSRVLLGEVKITSGTVVEVHARRDGLRLILHAVNSGSVVGRAESIAGLNTTPIYVMIDGKKVRIDVLWQRGN